MGDKRRLLTVALQRIEDQIGDIIMSSGLYLTGAWGVEDQPDFLNQVLEVESKLKPHGILRKIASIEEQMGRKHYEKWGPRVIDIDLLYYADKVIDSKKLSVPHLGIPDRRFTLVPLNEIAPNFTHPVLRKTNAELLSLCQDPLEVRPLLET